MGIVGDVRNPSQSGILNGTCKGECWISDDKMLGVTYSYQVGGCGVFGKIERIAFVKHCMKCGLVPHWDCVESNKGSVNLAESAGFVKIKERPFFWFDI